MIRRGTPDRIYRIGSVNFHRHGPEWMATRGSLGSGGHRTPIGAYIGLMRYEWRCRRKRANASGYGG